MHRLRAVRRRVPGAVHLRARRGQPGRRPGLAGERYGFVYEINYLRCIHCDLCVEACPTEAITETKLFEFSFTNRRDAIYTKDELLVDDDGKPQQLPWEDWREGDDLQHLGAGCGRQRRRATRTSRAGGLVGRARLRRPTGSASRAQDPACRRARTATG